MYNQEIKERFLNESFKNIMSSRDGFRKSEQLEIRTGKDIAEMTKEEAIETISAMDIREDSSLRSTLVSFKNYVKWCKDNSVFTNIPVGFIDIKPTDINLSEGIKDILFKNEFDFLSTLKSLREFDQGYPEPPTLCLIWLGLKAKEVIALKDSNINMKAQTVTINDEVVISGFSEAIAEVLQQYIDCKVAERDHRTGWRQVIKDYSTDYFLKRMLPRGHLEFGKPYGPSQISSSINRLNTKLEDNGEPARLKPDNVWNSGRYNTLWEIEKTGINITSPENRKIVEKVFRYSKSYYNAIRMYKAYKEAFNLN